MELGGPGRPRKQKPKTAVPSRVSDSLPNLIYSFLNLIHSCMNDGVVSASYTFTPSESLFCLHISVRRKVVRSGDFSLACVGEDMTKTSSAQCSYQGISPNR